MVRPWLYSLAGLFGFVLVAYVVIVYGLPLVMPFAVALIVAELINPVVDRLTFRGRVPRSLVVSLVLLIFVGILTLAFTAAVARLVEEVRSVVSQLPFMYDMALDLSEVFAEQFGRFSENLPDAVRSMLTENLTSFQKFVSAQAQRLVGALGVVSSLPSFITNLLIALIATFFMSRDKREISAFLISLFPRIWHDQLRRVKEDVWTSTMGWAKAQFALIFLTMVQTIIGLEIIGAEYAVTMGVIVGVADVMPVLGPAAVYLPWLAYVFITGNTAFGVKLLILYVTVAAVRQVLEPKLVGDQIGLHPLAILLALYLGFQFFGAVGFLVGPLLAILLKSLMESGLLPIFQDRKPK